MSFTLDGARNIFAGAGAPSPIPGLIIAFENLSIEDQLALLWYTYTETGRSITRAALGAASMSLVEGMLDQIRQMAPVAQTQVMIDIASRADSPLSRSYGYFSANTKLGFWYQLGEWMAQGLVAPAPANYQATATAMEWFETLKRLDGGQQIQVLRDAVVNMGYDAAVAPATAPKAENFEFERTEPIVEQISVEGVTESAVLAYFAAMNRDDFEKAITLFAVDGALQPPFQKPIVGPEAIGKYLREDAQGLNLLPERGITEYLPEGAKQLRITGKVQTPWFGVNVAMNIAWRFAINPDGKIFFLAIDMLASPEELLNLRPPAYR